MTAVDLMANLTDMGIVLKSSGDRLRFYPRSAVTPELAGELKRHKGELLAMLRTKAGAAAIDLTDTKEAWQAAAESADDFEPEVFGRDGWPMDSIDPDELDPCPKCGMLELWQTMAGNWRCLRCDPPTTARRLRERAMLQSDRTDSPRANAKAD